MHRVVTSDAFSTSVGEAAKYNSAQRKYAAPSSYGYKLPGCQRNLVAVLTTKWEFENEEISYVEHIGVDGLCYGGIL
ncbi:MAG: hypothetical protein R3E13_02790 [Alphaproteobacteria bacterium]